MAYKQLTSGQRHQIEILLKLGKNKSEIARLIGVSHSTVLRELERHSTPKGYNADSAQKQSDLCRKSAKRYRLPLSTELLVIFFLKLYFSPEQISITLKKIGVKVSYEWIYRFIRKDRQKGGSLYKYLRMQGKKYKKRTPYPKSNIPNRVGIEHRPEIINNRERIGDWEADLVHGKRGTGAIVTLLERKTRLLRLAKVPNKQADTVANAIIKTLKNHIVKSITFDNGSEFAQHQKIAQKLNAKTYFCAPYCAWQKGQNEHHNRLLRQFIPKSQDLTHITANFLKKISTLLNIRPKKALQHFTALKFYEYLYTK